MVFVRITECEVGQGDLENSLGKYQRGGSLRWPGSTHGICNPACSGKGRGSGHDQASHPLPLYPAGPCVCLWPVIYDSDSRPLLTYQSQTVALMRFPPEKVCNFGWRSSGNWMPWGLSENRSGSGAHHSPTSCSPNEFTESNFLESGLKKC